MIPDFCKNYLKSQGVLILPSGSPRSAPIRDKEKEFVPVVPQCEMGDLP